MRIFRLGLLALAFGLAASTSAFAHDSVGFSLNIGVPGYYAGPPVYYSPPPVVYYSRPPVVYYDPAPPVVYGPRIVYRYYDEPRRWHHRDWDDHRGWHDHR